MITSSLRSVSFRLTRRKADGRWHRGRPGYGPFVAGTTTRFKAMSKRSRPPRTVAALRLTVVGICRPSILSDTSSSKSSRVRSRPFLPAGSTQEGPVTLQLEITVHPRDAKGFVRVVGAPESSDLPEDFLPLD